MLLRKIRDKWAIILSWFRVCYCRQMGVSIGKNCYISRGAHIDVAAGEITIGNKVRIANGSYILSHTTGRRILGHTSGKSQKEGTVLEDNVRVFVNAVVLPGVKVGKNSFVGAGCVVVKDVPPNVVVMGNPARVIKHLENDED